MLYDSGPFHQPQLECKQLLFHLEGTKITQLLEESNFTKKTIKKNDTTRKTILSSLSPPLIPPETLLSSTELFSDESEEEFEYCEGGDDFSDDDFCPKNGEYYFHPLTSSQIDCDNDDEMDEKNIETPFWYANEDFDHIREIFAVYQMKLIKEEKTRSSQLFVGQITRLDATCGQDFQTFDEVSIFNEQIGSDSPLIPFVKKIFVVTTWDRSDGLPLHLFIVDKDEEDCLNFWRERVQRKNSKTSSLFCVPHFLAKGEYVYYSSSSPSDSQLCYQFDYQFFSKSQQISWF